MGNFDSKYEKVERLKLDNAVEDQELSLAQKKALIKKAKEQYGPNFKKVLGLVGKLKVNSEALHTMYGAGLGDLRDMNNPRKNFGR